MKKALLLEVYSESNAIELLKKQCGSILLSVESLSTKKYYNANINELLNIISIASDYNSDIIINLDRLYHPSDLTKAQALLLLLNEYGIKKLMIMDLGIISLSQDLGIEFIFINGNSTLNTNYYTMNSAKPFFDGHFISNEINITQIKKIIENYDELKVIQVFGKQKIFYSKRHLLTSYYDYTKQPVIDFGLSGNFIIADQNDEKNKSYILEDYHGTYLYTQNNVCSINYIDEIINNDSMYLYLSNLFLSEYNYNQVIDTYYQYLLENDKELFFRSMNKLDILYSDSFLNDETIFTLEQVQALEGEANNE